MKTTVHMLRVLVLLALLLSYGRAQAQVNTGGSGSVSLPTTLSAPGVFTSTQFNTNFDTTLTGGGTCNENTITNLGGSTFNLTNAFSGCVNLPTSGVTNGFTNVFGAYGINPNANNAGQFGWTGLVGYYSQIWCRGGSASNSRCWGANFSVSDDTSAPAVLFGNEYDITANNTTTTGFGTLYSFRGNGQPTSHNFPVIDVGAPAGTATFTDGFKTENNSISTVSGFAAINIGTQINTSPSNSQVAYFNARNSGGTVLSCGIELLGSLVGDTTNGTWGFGLCPLQVTEIAVAGTQSISGCTLSSALGGVSAGSFHAGATSCTVTITMNTAKNGFACQAQDMTTLTDAMHQSAFTTTTATMTGTVVSGDVITWSCTAF